MYFKDFPTTHIESRQNSILLPIDKIDAHENSIYEIEWINGDSGIVTASADKSSKVIDVETKTEMITFPGGGSKGHQGSIKCVQKVDQNGNLIATGGRDSKIILHDIRVKDGQAGIIQSDSLSDFVFT